MEIAARRTNVKNRSSQTIYPSSVT